MMSGFFKDEAGNRSMSRLQSFMMVTAGVGVTIAATAWAVTNPGADALLLGAMYGQASSMLLQGFISKNSAKKIERAGAQ